MFGNRTFRAKTTIEYKGFVEYNSIFVLEFPLVQKNRRLIALINTRNRIKQLAPELSMYGRQSNTSFSAKQISRFGCVARKIVTLEKEGILLPKREQSLV